MSVLTLDQESRRRLRRLQSAALSRLRERLNLSQVVMAERLTTSVSNYREYERGKQWLNLVHLRCWPAVFGISETAFLRELGLLRDEEPSVWWGRIELEAEGLPHEEIDRHEAFLIDRPLQEQRAFLDTVRREWRRRRPSYRREGGATAG
jgi:transcriptional regulator with XRE-family HTH domain